jgi:hypothetical protein
MKSPVLFVCCLLAILSLKAQTNIYHSFPDSNATWASTYDDINPGWIYDRFYLDGDTIMEGRLYNKVYNFINWNQRNFVGGIRQDTATKRVYAKLNNWMYPIYPPSIILFQDTGDVLLYDFSLAIGDSIKIPSVFSYYQYMYVINIDSIEVQGSYRRYLVLNSLLHPWVNSYWIEGIGSLNGLFWPRFDQEFGICNLECMTQDSVQLYVWDGVTYCPYYANSIRKNNLRSKVKVYPNPILNYLNVDLSDYEIRNAKYIIFDFIGKVIISKRKFLNTNPQLDLTSLLDGIYIIQIEIENQFYNYKFIKSSP